MAERRGMRCAAIFVCANPGARPQISTGSAQSIRVEAFRIGK